MKIVEQNVDLIQCTQNISHLIETIARTCYNSEFKGGEEGQKFLKKLIDSGHHSVFEHAYATFKIITDRGISHEIVRHRLASYTQSSTRYIKYDTDLPVIKPFDIEENQEDIWINSMEDSEHAYKKLLEKGCNPQVARDCLPTCTATTLYMTANFREWRHFITLRSSSVAHPKIQEISDQICIILHRLFPIYFEVKI